MKKKSVWRTTGACALMILIIAGAVGLGLYKHIEKLYDEAINYYYNSSGVSIWDELADKSGKANNLMIVAERYPENKKLQMPMSDLNMAIQEMEAYMDGIDEAEANRGLDLAFYALAQELEAMQEISESDLKLVGTIKADFQSHQYIINRSGYNEAAKEYNDTIQALPYSVIAFITGKGPMGIYIID